eukprot:1309679-Alexandrium_andersonii.AAC.1
MAGTVERSPPPMLRSGRASRQASARPRGACSAALAALMARAPTGPLRTPDSGASFSVVALASLGSAPARACCAPLRRTWA